MSRDRLLFEQDCPYTFYDITIFGKFFEQLYLRKYLTYSIPLGIWYTLGHKLTFFFFDQRDLSDSLWVMTIKGNFLKTAIISNSIRDRLLQCYNHNMKFIYKDLENDTKNTLGQSHNAHIRKSKVAWPYKERTLFLKVWHWFLLHLTHWTEIDCKESKLFLTDTPGFTIEVF